MNEIEEGEMATSEERREVAKRLRDYAANDGIGYSSDIAVYLALCDVFGDIEPEDDAKVERLLADLIDPTCHAEQDYDCDEPVQGRWWRCGACGERFAYERGLSPRFCPNCGAKAVDE
jgi:rubrerythrin